MLGLSAVIDTFSIFYLQTCGECVHESSSPDKLSHTIGDPPWGPDSGTPGNEVTGLNIQVSFNIA